MTKPPPKNPLIAVIGATGTGKSQLAVEIAKQHNGEIINGDAMQLYTGLPIITNKITVDEQQGIPHHLLGVIGFDEPTWVVRTFVKRALDVIQGIRSRGRLPILVGGTHYYLQSLLFHDRLAKDDGNGQTGEWVDDTKAQWPVLQESTEVLLEELRRVDPVMADRWHPNDSRKIQRSLEIYLQTGRKASEIYAEQRQAFNGNHERSELNDNESAPDQSEMRFPTLLFWVHSENDALRDRLDKRVETMLDHGLLAEVKTLSAYANAHAADESPVDETRGIWVSIGYKEFKEYIKTSHDGLATEAEFEKLKVQAIERTQAATRQYAKRQLRWIQIKLVNALARAGASDNLYLLDSSDVSTFDNDVVCPALNLTHTFLTSSHPLPDPTSLSTMSAEMLKPKRDYDMAATPEKWTRNICELCGVTCVTEAQWETHVKSKGHRKLVRKNKDG